MCGSPPSTEGSDAGDTERLEELPLCSCRMEAPRVDSTSHRVSRQCMATESINGEVCPLQMWAAAAFLSGHIANCVIVSLLRLSAEGLYRSDDKRRDHASVQSGVPHGALRSPSITHGQTPLLSWVWILLHSGKGFKPATLLPAPLLYPTFSRFSFLISYFLLFQGTFLECCPDQRIAHRFHRGCVTVLGSGRSRANGGGMLFCPHCGEDASEAQEVTIPCFSSATASATTVVTMSASSTTTPSLPPSVPTAPSLTASTGGMKDGKMPERPVR